MPSRGQSLTICYVAWDTSAEEGKAGDAANHTLRWIKDGNSAAPSNSPAEVDATNAPGVYKIGLTTSECTCHVGVLAGKSSTSGVVIKPVTVTFEQLPTATPGASGGLPLGDGNGRVDVSKVNGGALDGHNATVKLKNLDIWNSSGFGIRVISSDSNAIYVTSGVGAAVSVDSSGQDSAAVALNGNGSGAGLRLGGGATGPGLQAMGGSTSGAGIRAEGHANGQGDGIEAVGTGGGYDVHADVHGTIDACTTNADMRGTDGAALAATALSDTTWTDARAGYLDNLNGHTPQTGDSYARLGAPDGASVSADIATVDSNVDTLVTRVPAEVAQKQHLVNGTGDITPPADTGLWDRLDAAVSSRSSHDDPDPIGYIDTAISSRSSHAASDVTGGTTVAAAVSHGDSNWATATGFSTHSAADVVTALGTGSTLTDCATATGFAVAGDAMALTADYDAAKTAAQAGNAMTLTAAERNSVADAILQRDVDNVEAAANEHTLCTIVLAMLESSISGTTWTIKRTDGSTTHASKTVATDANADPITGVS